MRKLLFYYQHVFLTFYIEKFSLLYMMCIWYYTCLKYLYKREIQRKKNNIVT